MLRVLLGRKPRTTTAYSLRVLAITLSIREQGSLLQLSMAMRYRVNALIESRDGYRSQAL